MKPSGVPEKYCDSRAPPHSVVRDSLLSCFRITIKQTKQKADEMWPKIKTQREQKTQMKHEAQMCMIQMGDEVR